MVDHHAKDCTPSLAHSYATYSGIIIQITNDDTGAPHPTFANKEVQTCDAGQQRQSLAYATTLTAAGAAYATYHYSGCVASSTSCPLHEAAQVT